MGRPTVAIVLVPHGTQSSEGQSAMDKMLRHCAVELRRWSEEGSGRPRLVIREAFADIQEPFVGDAVDELLAEYSSGGTECRPEGELASATGEGVTGKVLDRLLIVPVLLGGGFHVETDCANAAARHPRGCVTPPLGPDPALTEHHRRTLARLGVVDAESAQLLGAPAAHAAEEKGHPLDDPLVLLGVAGSLRASGQVDARASADDLGAALGRPIGLVNAVSSPAETIAEARRAAPNRRVVIASHVLIDGFFAGRLSAAGADLVTPPVCRTAKGRAVLVDIVCRRVRETLMASPPGTSAAPVP